MTDPNIPPAERSPERPIDQSHTTINVAPERRGGGSGLAFVIGGLVVLVAVIAAVLYFRGAPASAPDPTDINVDIDVPSLPDAPRLPDAPSIPSPGPTTPSN